MRVWEKLVRSSLIALRIKKRKSFSQQATNKANPESFISNFRGSFYNMKAYWGNDSLFIKKNPFQIIRGVDEEKLNDRIKIYRIKKT